MIQILISSFFLKRSWQSTITGFILMNMIGCGANFAIVRDDVSTGRYSRTLMNAGFLRKSHFDQFIVYSRRSIVEDRELSGEEKKNLVSVIDNLNYSDNKYLYFNMVYNMPFLPEELRFQFNLTDSKSKDYIKEVYLIPLKIYEISEYGTRVSYNYTWVIEANPPIDSMQVNSRQPLTLRIQFPDQKERVYNIDGI